MNIGFSPHRFNVYRCQSTEGSRVKVSGPRGFKDTGVSPQSVLGYKCQSAEGL